MGVFGAIAKSTGLYKAYKKQEEKYDWGGKLSKMGDTGKVYNRINEGYNSGRDRATQFAAKHNVDRPGGGEIGRFTNWGRDVWHKGETALFGKRDQRNEGGDGGGADEYLAGSRANYLRKGQYAKTDKFADRRSLDAFDTGTLLTQGQKAKKLKKA